MPEDKSTLKRYALSFYNSNEYWDQPACFLYDLDEKGRAGIREMVAKCRQFMLETLRDRFATVYVTMYWGTVTCLTHEAVRAHDEWDEWFEAIPVHGGEPLDVTERKDVPALDTIDWPMEARVENFRLRINMDSVWITCVCKDSSYYLEAKMTNAMMGLPEPPPYVPLLIAA